MKRTKKATLRQQRERQQLAMIEQARRTWLHQVVRFDLGQGDGVQFGMVTDISDEGDVLVICLPGFDRRVAALTMSLGYVERVLTVVTQ